MKEDIRTIPINDIFMEKKGCPFCTMEKMLEKIQVDYIIGDAMMEPNTRIETNKKGFCHRHFSMMQQSGKKLPNALIMESHLQEIIDALEKRSRVLVVDASEGLGSTAELMEYAKELGRNRNDLYEIPVWRESINVVGNELYYMQAVHQESDVVPENIDAIRALLEMESDNEKSIAKTNKAMGIL